MHLRPCSPVPWLLYKVMLLWLCWQVVGFRRVFAHTAPIFFQRGIARLDTMEISSLSCEEAPGHSIVVSVFDVPHSPEMVEASCKPARYVPM
jgi:hypothetical protein